ncbi:hypothetical protein QIA17_06550 (plasmid) [Borreliella californiensis]|uniref:Chromosome segregation ATPase n=1 Tax=Borreliella californiensis TaxID=373543 RepID=A0A7W9ZLR8_9SPIR|nr:hypothetical protein [Borreliella californiensis]MBB6213891.1 chromosome segregation ATPase [Borreliella californiensis]
MNKKMFTICVVFALIVSCKNYASGEDVKKSLEQSEQELKKQVKGFLDTKKEEFFVDFEKPEAKVQPKADELVQADESQEQGEDQAVQEEPEDSELKEIEKQIRELKEKIEKSDGKTTIGKYCEYEEEIKKIREKIKELQNEEKKGKLETELKELDESLEKKKKERKKELEETKKKFEEYKEQVEGAGGRSEGDRAKNQGNIGVTAWQLANKLGFKGVTGGGNSSDTGDMTKKTIENALQKIDEELKK